MGERKVMERKKKEKEEEPIGLQKEGCCVQGLAEALRHSQMAFQEVGVVVFFYPVHLL